MKPLLDRLLPQRFDNEYRGPTLALWLFAVVVALKTSIALGTVFNGRAAAQSADGIPIATFGVDGAATVVMLFALWGTSQLIVSVLGAFALARYRTMIPLMFVLLSAYQIATRWISHPSSASAAAHPGTYINVGLLVLLLIGTVLSLWQTTPEDKMKTSWNVG